jgi:glycosyltransferase involved in cell wall biosynthesis
LAQEFTDFEFILVDDGSTDDTKEVIGRFEDDRIRYIYQENGERGKARNTGTRQAKGKYVFFLDSDDLIYPNHLAHAHAQLTEHNFPEFFHSRYELICGTRKTQVPAINPRTIQQQIARQNLFACQFFLRRAEALQFPFSENRALKIGEDWLVILQIANRFELHVSNKVTAAIVQHGERSMEVAEVEEILNSLTVLVKDLQKDTAISGETIRNVKAEFYTLAALSAAIAHKKRQALGLWLKGVWIRGRHLFKRRTLAIFKKILLNGKA